MLYYDFSYGTHGNRTVVANSLSNAWKALLAQLSTNITTDKAQIVTNISTHRKEIAWGDGYCATFYFDGTREIKSSSELMDERIAAAIEGNRRNNSR